MKCCDLSAGKMRHEVTFESKSEVPDGGGGSTGAWTTSVGPFKGMLKPTGTSEQFRFARLEANISHVFYCRYRTDLSTKMRLVYDGRNMQVRGIKNLEERNKWLELALEEGVET